MPSIILVILCAASSLLATAIAVLYLRPTRPSDQDGAELRGVLDSTSDGEIVFLFDGETLIDATAKARAQLSPDRAMETGSAWARFVKTYAHRFDDLERQAGDAVEGHKITLHETPGDPDSLRMDLSRVEGCLRVTLTDPSDGAVSYSMERYSLAAMRAELSTLRSIAEQSPVPTWKQRKDGTIIWANTAYMDLAREVSGPGALFGWPPPDLFAGVDMTRIPDATAQRAAINLEEDDTELWFSVNATEDPPGRLYFATPIDKLVRAETALSEFVQTLTKTFAHLTIGLAIFDRKRQLALFNPALVDLTGLPPEQLSLRPTLHTFLDALRERQRIPEPKDYRSWRLQIAQLEAGAADGTYEETWHLPTGQTYRVTGRPHPDGAVAYVFEDISSEISMTRSFRSEIELGQSVLDAMDTAVAVFTQAGVLSMSNRAYTTLWQSGPMAGLADTGVLEASRDWQARSGPSPVWSELRRFVLDGGPRETLERQIELRDGRKILIHARPLPRGASLLQFRDPEAGVLRVTENTQDQIATAIAT